MRTAAAIVSFCILFFQLQLTAQLPAYKLRVDVVERLARAINYRHRSGSTTVGFRGEGGRGEAKVESKQGYFEIEAEFDDMAPARRYGPGYLTYVLWGITPQGRSSNLGEVILNGTKSKLDVTTDLQTFGMVVTAEPYFAVSQPSDKVVLENYVRPDTVGKVEEISARYELVEQHQFDFDRMPARFRPERIDASLPLDLQQARNAVRIAEWFGAGQYAPDVMAHSRELMNQAEDYFVRHAGSKPVSMISREAVQSAEDARLIALKHQQETDRRDAAAKVSARLASDIVEQERSELRDRFVQQVRRMFEARDTGSSLRLNLMEGLFEPGKASLARDGREKLSRVAGLILAHPGIRLDIENDSLVSQKRVPVVRDYLVQQGVPARSINTRQLDLPGRSARIELVITGDLMEAARK